MAFAASFGDVLVLSRADFETVMARYPAELAGMQALAVRRRRQELGAWGVVREAVAALRRLRRIGAQVSAEGVLGAGGWWGGAVQPVDAVQPADAVHPADAEPRDGWRARYG